MIPLPLITQFALFSTSQRSCIYIYTFHARIPFTYRYAYLPNDPLALFCLQVHLQPSHPQFLFSLIRHSDHHPTLRISLVHEITTHHNSLFLFSRSSYLDPSTSHLIKPQTNFRWKDACSTFAFIIILLLRVLLLARTFVTFVSTMS